MAKDLPFFKFKISEWNDGDVTLCSMEAQGLFINICSLYWSRNGDLDLSKAKRKFRIKASIWKELIEENIFKVKNDKIVIDFLEEQFQERKKLSEINSKNASQRSKSTKDEATANLSDSDGTDFAHNLEERREEEKRKEQRREEGARDYLKPSEESKLEFQAALEMADPLIEFFNVHRVHGRAEMNKCASFILFLIDKGQLDEFWKQFEAYKAYKAKSDEKIHGLDGFLGDPPEYNGGWCQDWIRKNGQTNGRKVVDPTRKKLGT